MEPRNSKATGSTGKGEWKYDALAQVAVIAHKSAREMRLFLS
jgi:hypothetical protein